ncbi:MAG: hypothetical protein LBL90_02915, partial [Prevotellaceae bacterium]|nr:hypothetical protein [Prevotellaceae bacterium]
SQIDEGIAQEHTPETDSGTSPVDSASLRKMIDKINECTLKEKAQTKEEKQIKELLNHQQKLYLAR